MKKGIFIIFCLIFMASCFNKKIDGKIEVNSGSTGTINTINYDGIEIDISSGKLDNQRSEITLDDIELINFSENETEKNELLTIGKKFVGNLEKTKQSDLTKKVDGGISFQSLENEVKKIPEKLKKEVDLELKIYDFETKKIIDKGIIFVNGINLGEFEKGEFNKVFSWVKGIENFTVMVRASGYGDAFVKLNSINTEGSYLFSEVYMKKVNSEKKLKLDKETTYEDKNLIVKIPECSLVDNEGNCYKGEVETKINFISAEDVNSGRISLNMRAITKEGKIVYLQSGGMAFTDFLTPAGDILQVAKGKTIEITYKVDEETIKDMEANYFGTENKNGYWLYDKNKNIWLEKEAEIKLDKENKTWTAIVSEIY